MAIARAEQMRALTRSTFLLTVPDGCLPRPMPQTDPARISNFASRSKCNGRVEMLRENQGMVQRPFAGLQIQADKDFGRRRNVAVRRVGTPIRQGDAEALVIVSEAELVGDHRTLLEIALAGGIDEPVIPDIDKRLSVHFLTSG